MFKLSLVVLTASALSGWAEAPATGHWEGSIQIPGHELKVVVDLAQNAGDGWIGSITMPGLLVKGAELSGISTKDSDVSFAIKDALAAQRVGPVKFKGQMISAGELAGNFLQAGNSAVFRLAKTGPPQVELPVRSTAVGKEIEGLYPACHNQDHESRRTRRDGGFCRDRQENK
jgi:hypothetical protein